MWPPWPILIFMLTENTVVQSFVHDDLFGGVQKSSCYSCASFIYLPMWSQLMHHYFPPKNFTDRCWNPDESIGTVACTSACFTLIERIDPQQGRDSHSSDDEHQGVLRGCVDRLLLFGLDDDVRNILTSYSPSRVCRETDRKILRLYPLSHSSEVVTLCSCTGERCNEQDMLLMSSSSLISRRLLPYLLLFWFFS